MNLRVLFALTVALSIPAAAQPTYESYAPKDWKLADADAQKLAMRLRRLIEGARMRVENAPYSPMFSQWSVTVKGNDLIIQHDQPLMFATLIEKGGVVAEGPAFKDTYRLILRMTPVISLEKYDELVAENRRLENDVSRLQNKYGLEVGADGKSLTSTTSMEKEAERIKDYLKESSKIVLHQLPDFYTPDSSLTLYQSRAANVIISSSVDYKRRECAAVKDSLAKYFGQYSMMAVDGLYHIGSAKTLEEK